MRIKLHASYFTTSRLDFKEVVHHALWIYSIYVLFNTKRIVFVTSNAHLFWHTSCKTMPLSWWSIIANYSLPRRLRPKEDAWHVFCHRLSQDPGIPKLVVLVAYICTCVLYVFVLLAYLFLPPCILTHILLETFCLFVCICTCVLCVFICYGICTFPFVF